MHLSLIVAASENNVIGNCGALPWHLPDDLKLFRARTEGHPVIMGRKTFASIGRALPNRTNIVVSRTLSALPGCNVARSLTAAFVLAAKTGTDESFVIGGGEIYREAMKHADRIYLTRVHATIEGDAFFPGIDPSVWREMSRERHEVDAQHAYAFSCMMYEKPLL